MKIERINKESVQWFATGKNSKYRPLYEKIRGLKIGECIKVELDTPSFLFSYIFSALRKDRRNNKNIQVKIRNLENTGTAKPSKSWAVLRIR